MSAREQALPAALEELRQWIIGMHDDEGLLMTSLSKFSAALSEKLPVIRRELLAEVGSEPATAERVEEAEQGEPAGWGTVEAVANRVLGKHAKHTVEHLLARLRPLWPAQPPASDAKSELIRIAADLVRMEAPLPSNPEDHHQKTYSAGVVARAMERHEDALTELAVRVRRVFDKLPPAQPPASGELGELPADWREAVEGALDSENPPPGWITNTAVVSGAVIRALAPLVLGERLRAERLRRSLEEIFDLCHKGGDSNTPGDPPIKSGFETVVLVADHALAADPPDAALAELLGLPALFEEHVGLWHASRLRAVLAKLGLPAGEEAGDG